MLVAFALTGCTPDTFEGADPNGIPTVEGVTPVITVDQDLNQVTFALPGDMKGVMPVWIYTDDKGVVNYSTVNGLQKIFAKAGEYDVEMKLMNRNGISDGSVKAKFKIDNTIVNFDKYIALLCGGTTESSKEWRIDNEKPAHLACGDTRTDGTGWWSAGANEKAGTGLYDNRLVFASDYSYTFNPGENGTMYVNYGTTALNTTGATEDFALPVQEMKSTYAFDVEGNDIYLTLPAHTNFPYIPNDEMWANPRYRVESISGSEVVLISDNGSIAWHYVLTSGSAKVEFKGFKYDSEFNMWKPVDDNNDFTTHFYYAPGWAQIADPGFAKAGSEYTFTLPQATSDQWQAQCPIKPSGLHLSADKKYDFSVIINSSENIKGVTVKLTDVNSGDNFVFAERVDVTAYEDCIFYLSDVNNLSADADCELFFDFGGNPANTTVTVKSIVVKDHANDDGTVLPSVDPEKPSAVDWREADNLLANMNVDISQYYAPGWAQIADAQYTAADGKYTIIYPEAAGDQWQAQFTFNNTGVRLDPKKKYDFRCKLLASSDHPGVTVKLTQQDDDNTYLTADRHALKAYEETWIELVGLSFVVNGDGKGVIENLKMPFDFGGIAAGTEIIISDMLLQEHKASPDELTWNADAPDNLWTANLLPNSFYYAPGWAQIANPTISQNGRAYTVSLPTATADQWQAQVTTETEIATSAGQAYDFQVILTSNNDIAGATIKLTMVGNDEVYYTADRHKLTAYEPYTFRLAGMPGLDINKIKLVLDFGGAPDNTEVEVKDIILRPANDAAKRHRVRK